MKEVLYQPACYCRAVDSTQNPVGITVLALRSSSTGPKNFQEKLKWTVVGDTADGYLETTDHELLLNSFKCYLPSAD